MEEMFNAIEMLMQKKHSTEEKKQQKKKNFEAKPTKPTFVGVINISL